MKLFFPSLMVSLILSACSINQSLNRDQIADTLALKRFEDIAQFGTPIPDASIKDLNQQVIRVYLPSRGQSFFATKTGGSANRVHYQSAQGQSIELQGDRIVATRGLGFDLISTQVTRDGTVQMTFLNGNNQPFEIAKRCTTKSRLTTSVEKLCSSGGIDFTESDWEKGPQTLRRSQQWIGSRLGMIYLEWLN